MYLTQPDPKNLGPLMLAEIHNEVEYPQMDLALALLEDHATQLDTAKVLFYFICFTF